MSSKIFAIVMLLAAVLQISLAIRTHCERSKGNSEIRCAKDNFPEDSITISRHSDRQGGNVEFRIGTWLSWCGHPGTNLHNEHITLGSGKEKRVTLQHANEHRCFELYIHDCKHDGRSEDCGNRLKAVPN